MYFEEFLLCFRKLNNIFFMFGSISPHVERLISKNVDMQVQAYPVSRQEKMQAASQIFTIGIQLTEISEIKESGSWVYLKRPSAYHL